MKFDHTDGVKKILPMIHQPSVVAMFWHFFGLSKLVDRRLKTTIIFDDRRLKTTIKFLIRQLPHVDLLPQVIMMI